MARFMVRIVLREVENDNPYDVTVHTIAGSND